MNSQSKKVAHLATPPIRGRHRRGGRRYGGARPFIWSVILCAEPMPELPMPLPSRELMRLNWTRDALDDPQVELESASADASFRSYWRALSDGQSWIVMDAPPDREDIRPWLDIAGRLNGAGLHAPQIRAADAEAGFVLMSDLGGRLYLPELNELSADALYGDALDALLRMQAGIDAADLPPYDEQRLVNEMELLPEWFLQRHLGFTPDCGEWDVIETAFRALTDNASRQEQVFVHRDYHSRNLLLTAENNPGILDFQDAVRGPITYDLVSLLRDCYIAWPDARVYDWVESYRLRLLGAGLTRVDAETFRHGFDLMGLQRHIKVLGIFCRLWYRDGKAAYLKDLPLVWRYTREVGARHPETAPLIALIERALGARDITLPSA
jgi:aminoglycoside/choline kinase family phosphotransferase